MQAATSTVESSTKYLTAKQLSKLFPRLSVQTIRRLYKKNEIPHLKIGRQYFFIEAEIEAWARKNAQLAKKTEPLLRLVPSRGSLKIEKADLASKKGG